MRIELIESKGNLLKVIHRPNRLGKLFGIKEKTIEYRSGYSTYVFHNCDVYYFQKTGKEVGIIMSKKLEILKRKAQWNTPQPKLTGEDIVESGLWSPLKNSISQKQ